MSENKILKEFLKNTYNQEKNYNSICSKIEKNIYEKKKVLNVAALILIVLVIGVTANEVYAKVAWNIACKKYQERNIISKTIALDEGSRAKYSEKIDMNYIYKDKIGVKITSLILTNDYMHVGLDIKFEEEPNVNESMINYGFAIYDENNNVYCISKRTSKNKVSENYYKKIYEELGIYNPFKNYKLGNSTARDISGITIISDKGFPQTKKLYIRIFDIGYIDFYSDKDICLSESEWQFEIDVPKKFYERTAIELVAKEEVEGIIINKVELTETDLLINIKINEFLTRDEEMKIKKFQELKNMVFYISDGDGNIYTANQSTVTRR